jgi:hypothetical protein
MLWCDAIALDGNSSLESRDHENMSRLGRGDSSTGVVFSTRHVELPDPLSMPMSIVLYSALRSESVDE